MRSKSSSIPRREQRKRRYCIKVEPNDTSAPATKRMRTRYALNETRKKLCETREELRETREELHEMRKKMLEFKDWLTALEDKHEKADIDTQREFNALKMKSIGHGKKICRVEVANEENKDKVRTLWDRVDKMDALLYPVISS